MKEQSVKGGLPSTLLSINLKIRPESQDVEFARSLYLLGHLFGRERMFIRGEGLFANATQLLEKSNRFEKVECCLLFGNMLRQIDIRQREGEELIRKGKAMASEMPFWYPYLVNLIVPEMDFK